jgi:hypothetical protein
MEWKCGVHACSVTNYPRTDKFVRISWKKDTGLMWHTFIIKYNVFVRNMFSICSTFNWIGLIIKFYIRLQMEFDIKISWNACCTKMFCKGSVANSTLYRPRCSRKPDSNYTAFLNRLDDADPHNPSSQAHTWHCHRATIASARRKIDQNLLPVQLECSLK